jgi:hypothetical protein
MADAEVSPQAAALTQPTRATIAPQATTAVDAGTTHGPSLAAAPT